MNVFRQQQFVAEDDMRHCGISDKSDSKCVLEYEARNEHNFT